MSASASATEHRRAPEGVDVSRLAVRVLGGADPQDALSRCGWRPLGSAFSWDPGNRPGWPRSTPVARPRSSRMTSQIADALADVLELRGVLMVVDAERLCFAVRGIRKATRSRSLPSGEAFSATVRQHGSRR